MNTTICRIAASAPVAVALLGFSFGSAHAAPYDPSSADKVQMQPADKPEWDIDLPISDDLPDGDPPAPPDDIAPADPADEPADDESDDEESDENADDDTNGSGNGTNSSTSSSNGGSKGSEKVDTYEAGDGAEQAPVEAAVPFTPASASGVQVPPELVAAAGAALAGVVGWAGYRRRKANA